jgi:hypothetical protein
MLPGIVSGPEPGGCIFLLVIILIFMKVLNLSCGRLPQPPTTQVEHFHENEDND